jgi:hypothetical protein
VREAHGRNRASVLADMLYCVVLIFQQPLAARELDFDTWIVAQDVWRLGLCSLDQFQPLAHSCAFTVPLAKCFGLQIAKASETGRCLLRDHVRVAPYGHTSRICSARAKNDGKREGEEFHEIVPEAVSIQVLRLAAARYVNTTCV